MHRTDPADRRSAGDRRTTQRGGRRDADVRGRPLILLVEDHTDSRELLAAVLQDVGAAIAEAGSGRDALARITSGPAPDIVLLDLSLPDCHGTEIVRQLKQNPRTAGIPIVALSASVMETDREAAAAAGCAAFIGKPLLPEDVVSLVRRLLAGAGA